MANAAAAQYNPDCYTTNLQGATVTSAVPCAPPEAPPLLPVTGMEVGLIGAVGVALFLGGSLLRRKTG